MKFNIGDELTIHSCQLSGCYNHPDGWTPHTAVPGRYVITDIVHGHTDIDLIYMLRIDSTGPVTPSSFRCDSYHLSAIVGDWSNYTIADCEASE